MFLSLTKDSVTKKNNVSVCTQISGLDWLEFSIIEFFDDSKKLLYQLANDRGWSITEKSGKNFKEIYVVSYYAQELFTIATKNNLSKDITTLKFSNELLYSPDSLVTLCNLVLAYTRCRIRGITRLDVYTDSPNFSMNDSFRSFQQIKGGSTVTPIYKRRQLKQVTVGSRSSEKYFKLYNKSDELKTSNKPYIKQLHDSKNFHSTVYRLEVTLKSKCLQFFRNIRNSITVDWLVDLVRFGISVKDSYLITRTGRKIFKFFFEGLQKIKFFTRKIVKTTFSVKVAIKTFVYELLANGRFSINDLILKYRLSGWVDKKFPYWYKDFQDSFWQQKQLSS